MRGTAAATPYAQERADTSAAAVAAPYRPGAARPPAPAPCSDSARPPSHPADCFPHPQTQVINETLPALQALKAQGLVRFVGITGLPLPVFKYVLDRAPPGGLLGCRGLPLPGLQGLLGLLGCWGHGGCWARQLCSRQPTPGTAATPVLPCRPPTLAHTHTRAPAAPGAVDVVLSYCHYSLNDTTLGDLIPYLQVRRAPAAAACVPGPAQCSCVLWPVLGRCTHQPRALAKGRRAAAVARPSDSSGRGAGAGATSA
jgi:hypothetical protein